MDLFIYADGASKGNPGDAGIGIVVEHLCKTVREISEYIGHATAQEAEFRAIIRSLQEAEVMGASRVTIYSDCSHAVNYINGGRNPQTPDEVALTSEAVDLIGAFRSVRVRWIHREKNTRADQLATAGVEKHRAREIDAGLYSNIYLGSILRNVPDGTILERIGDGWVARLPMPPIEITGESPEIVIKELSAQYERMIDADKRESVQKHSGWGRRAQKTLSQAV